MDRPILTGKITKRQFIRLCAGGLGGLAVGLGQSGVFAAISPPLKAGTEREDDLWKWSREAEFFVETPRGIRCIKCPNECELRPGDTGRCRNRVNHRGKLYSIAYGNPCAVHVDPVEKKPFFHFLPSTRAFSIATAGCNLACLNCQNWEISQMSPKETQNADLMPADVVTSCNNNQCASIAYTYSEPTSFYEYTFDTALLARKRGIKNLLKSNGYINQEPLRKLCGVLDAANIDLKSFDDALYGRLSGGKLAPVLDTLRTLKKEGVWLEITNLVIPGWTDDLTMVQKMCEWLSAYGLADCPLHFSRFTPLYKLAHLPLTPVSTLEHARDIAKKAGIKYVYIGNVPGHQSENTYCHGCGKLIIERRGYTITGKHISQGKCEYCKATIPGVWA